MFTTYVEYNGMSLCKKYSYECSNFIIIIY